MNKWTQPFEWSRASATPAEPVRAAGGPHYFAFLSYSHEDSADADWLHKELEHFRVPHGLAGRLTAHGVVPKRLTPVFRDQHELAASRDLGEEIRLALVASRALIVLCSPAAAKSKWTNAEIDAFKRLHPDGCIIAAVIAGEPLASDIPGREQEECFPPALVAKYNRRGKPTGKKTEPLAADLREGKGGRRIGFLKIVAGILGIGLDELVRRDTLRRQRRLAWLAAASLGGMAVTSTLAVAALQARDEARDQRKQAEGLVGFMLGDLKDKLEPIGRLDALDAVGGRALAYYEQQDKSQLSDEALAQRSRALTLMGEIAQKRGDLDGALRRYREAMAGTAEALRRDPANGDRIYDHAQNMFWVGFLADQRHLRGQAEAAFREYKRLADQLVAIDPAHEEWRLEPIYADTNLGAILMEEARYSEAADTFQRSLPRVESLLAANPSNRAYQDQLGETLAYLSQARESEGSLDEALGHRERQMSLLDRQSANGAADASLKRKMLAAHRALGRLFAQRGDVAQGLDHLRTSARLADDLAATEPANTEWSEKRAATYIDLGELQLAAGSAEQAGSSARVGCDLARRLAERDSSVVAWAVTLRADCLALRTRLDLAQHSNVEAAALADQAYLLRRQAAVKNPTADNRLRMAEALLLRGEAARAEGNRALAERAWRTADKVWPRDTELLPQYLVSRALILSALGRDAEAKRVVEQLERMGYRHPAFAQQMRLIR